MDFQDLIDTPRKVKTLAGTVVFLLAFPIYFEAMPSLIDEDISGGGSSGLTGTLLVSFEEFETTSSESVTLGDGENYDTFFVFESIETGLSIGFVELQISCFDNDDPGPGFTDTVDGESDLSDLEGIEDQAADGACSGGGGGGFTIRWDVTENYTGADYTEDEMSESEIREIWSDNGKGRGTWAATITATIEAAPVAGGFIDDDEEYEISWTAVYFDLAIEAQ
mgnify:FL=1|tara:strand:+ start:5152 stop:5820 length:669 start_codon:yes stop_codon:yes gene_type:complete